MRRGPRREDGELSACLSEVTGEVCRPTGAFSLSPPGSIFGRRGVSSLSFCAVTNADGVRSV